jgi:hypothetical protein
MPFDVTFDAVRLLFWLFFIIPCFISISISFSASVLSDRLCAQGWRGGWKPMFCDWAGHEREEKEEEAHFHRSHLWHVR